MCGDDNCCIKVCVEVMGCVLTIYGQLVCGASGEVAVSAVVEGTGCTEQEPVFSEEKKQVMLHAYRRQ